MLSIDQLPVIFVFQRIYLFKGEQEKISTSETHAENMGIVWPREILIEVTVSCLSVLTKILTEFAKKCYILELKLILTIQSKFSLLELIFY